jgi:phage shock protein PspC (stress-responsive transcriptional regulator)
MTTTPPDTGQPHGPSPDSGPRVGWDDIRDLARIRRSRANRRVAGVAGGLGRHLDIDPVILRVAFVVLTFFGGVGLLLYVALWLLLPEDGSDWAKIKLDRRSRTVALVLVGVLALLLLVSHGWWGDGGPFFLLAILVAVIAVAAQLVRRDRSRPGTPPGQADPLATYDVPAAASGTESGAPQTGEETAVQDASPATATSPYAPPPSYAVPEQPRPVNPRKKGPILFWFALAVMAVTLGTLGIADLAGADVAPSAYPATVLGLSAAFLLIGSFFGRAGGIILVGLVAGAATVGTTVADRWDPHSTTVVPSAASAVQPEYTMDVGEIRLDLTDVRDPQALDGRTIHLTGNVGHIEIRVPDGVTVESNSDVTGIGGINAFGRDSGGIDTSMTAVHDAGAGTPHLTIDTDLRVGGIDVHVGRDH